MPTRTGTVPAAVTEGFQRGVFETAPPRPLLGTAAVPVQASWHIPVILVDFTDQALNPAYSSQWESALFDTTQSTATGSVFDYYRWVSGQRVHITGKVVATVHLPQTKSYYAGFNWGLGYTSTPHNSYGVVRDALNACDPQVDWSPFDRDYDGVVDMLWVIHSGIGGEATVATDNLWSITSRMGAWGQGRVFISNDSFPGSEDQMMRLDRFAILPELSARRPGQRSEIGVYCHEFGHALGLPDLYDTFPLSTPINVGPGNWSLMSTGAYGGDGLSPESPAHVGAWPSVYLGWSQTVRPARDTLMTLAPIEQGGPVLELWFQGESSPEHFLIENRQRLGFDRTLLNEGLIVYQVNDAFIASRLPANMVNAAYPLNQPGVRIVEADGLRELLEGTSHGDPRDLFPGDLGVTRWSDDTTPNTRSMFGSTTNVSLREIEQLGDDVRFHAQVQAPGWLPPQDRSHGTFIPLVAPGPATRAVLHDNRWVSAVVSEQRQGRARIMLRERMPDGEWLSPLEVSESPASAIEPALATLPGGDLAVVWSDTRHGFGEIYYRVRVRGVWLPETRLTDLPGHSRTPSISADPQGGVHVAWLYTDSGIPRILFMYFPYLSAFGDPRIVTGGSQRPDAPVVAAAPDGSSYLLWPDRGSSPTMIWFAHFDPDSGIRPANRLAPGGEAQPAVQAVVDWSGNLHSIWNTTGSGNQIHYQRRDGGPLIPPSVVIENRGESIQNCRMALDVLGGIHVVMEALTAGVPQVRYKRYEPGRGWDLISTEVTLAENGTAVRPCVLVSPERTVSVLYTGYPGGIAGFYERMRNPSLLATPTAAPPVAAGPSRWTIAPNPSRRGAALVARWAGADAPPGPAEIFDLAGRRVAAHPFRRDGAEWVAEFGPASVQWPSGVYFARAAGVRDVARFVILR
jgi:immune inhibitor A